MQIGTKFCRQSDGNIALMTALMMVPLLGLTVGVIDVTRMMNADARLQSAVESGVLAAASLTNTLDIADVVDQYIDANIPPGDFRDSISVTVPTENVALNARTIEVVATGTIEPLFLKLFGIGDFTISSSAIANQGSTNVELALVLDISSSMRGAKITNLRTAANLFIDQILNDDVVGTTSMSIIPFGGTVNIGQDLFDELAVPLSSATVDPTESQYNQGASVPTDDFRFSDGDTCVEYTNSDFDSGTLPSESRSQVPLLWKWTNLHPWCPPEDSTAIFNSNDRTKLHSLIDDMLLSDGTGMDIGAMWGAKALSPEWQNSLGGNFSDRPAAYDGETLKVFVLMTDGEITSQYRPKNYTYFSTHKKVIALNPVGGSTSGTGGIPRDKKNKNQQTILSKGNLDKAIADNFAVSHFRRICDEIKADGAVIYTIGFNINENKISNDLLLECATNPGNYYFVEGLDIQAAFDAIAASVSALRVVG